MSEEKTVGQFVKEHNVVIMRGLPGSGKTTLVESVMRPQDIVCSADDYFTDGTGQYKFDPEYIGRAHEVCFAKFLRALSDPDVYTGKARVFVDNTGIHVWEISPYMLAAKAHSAYTVGIVEVYAPVAECINRCVHGVPKDTILRMYSDRRKEKLPPWWPAFTVIS